MTSEESALMFKEGLKMGTSNLSHIPLPDITLPNLHTDTVNSIATAVPSSQPNFTLPDPTSIPSVFDNAEMSEQQKTMHLKTEVAGKLQGPERDAKTLGEFKMCKLCNIYLNSKGQADMHYAGKGHQKKLKQKAFLESVAPSSLETTVPVSKASDSSSLPVEDKGLYLPHCAVCGITFTGASQVQMHLTGARHAKKLRQLEQKQKVEQVDSGVKSELEQKAFYCTYCDTTCTSQMQLDQHFQGSKHKNVIDAARNAPTNRCAESETSTDTKTASFMYMCPTCNVTTNSEQQYLQHCGSAKHKNKLLHPMGRDNTRHQPYPVKRHVLPGKGQASSNNNLNANRSKWANKWGNNRLNTGSDSFNYNKTSSTNDSCGFRHYWGKPPSQGGRYGCDPTYQAMASSNNEEDVGYSSAAGTFDSGYNSSFTDANWSNQSVNHTLNVRGRGRGWHGNWKKKSFQPRRNWGNEPSQMMLAQLDIPDLGNNFVKSSEEQYMNTGQYV